MQEQRQQLLEISRQLCQRGLNRGTSGNVSVRVNDDNGRSGFLITPSGMPIDQMQADDMVWMDFSANWTGRRQPSSEWRFHLDIHAKYVQTRYSAISLHDCTGRRG